MGAKAVEEQHESGKWTARERIEGGNDLLAHYSHW
jgi:acetyl-CoA carboxylase carboxyltransferase component